MFDKSKLEARWKCPPGNIFEKMVQFDGIWFILGFKHTGITYIGFGKKTFRKKISSLFHSGF